MTPTQRLFRQLNPLRQQHDDTQSPSTTEVVPIQSFMPGSTTSVLIISPVVPTSIPTEATTTTMEIPMEIPESGFSTPLPTDKSKSIKDTKDSPPKIVKATREVRPDPDAPVLIDITLHNVKVFRGTHVEVVAAMEEDEKIRAKLLSKPMIAEVSKEVIKETKQNIRGEQFLQL